jgi:hypothetical protein
VHISKVHGYEKVSSQKLNKEKTCKFFSKNTSKEAKEQIVAISGYNLQKVMRRTWSYHVIPY